VFEATDETRHLRSTQRKISLQRAVKKYRRSAAGTVMGAPGQVSCSKYEHYAIRHSTNEAFESSCA
jgi:hypothetical protein